MSSRGYLSPEIVYTESEIKSDTTPIVETIVGIIGPATKGPFEPVAITTVKKLHQVFGYAYLGEENGKKVYSKAICAAERVLKYTSNLLFCRMPIDEDEQEKFVFTGDDLSFTVDNFDSVVKDVIVSQLYDEETGEFTYNFDIKYEDYSGIWTENVATNIPKSEIVDALAYDGRLKDVKVGNLPWALPEKKLSKTYPIENDKAEDEAFSFEVVQPDPVIAKTYTIVDDTASDDAMTIIVKQPAEVTKKVYDIVNHQASDEALTIVVNQPLPIDTDTLDVKNAPEFPIVEGSGFRFNVKDDTSTGLPYELEDLVIDKNSDGTYNLTTHLTADPTTDVPVGTNVLLADIIDTLNSSTYFENAIRLSVDPRVFPIKQDPEIIVDQVEVVKGTGDSYTVISRTNGVPKPLVTGVTKANLITSLTAQGDLTVTTALPDTDRNFPIVQLPLVVLTEVSIVNDDEKYTITAKNDAGEQIKIAVSVPLEDLLQVVEERNVIQIIKGAQFPIVQVPKYVVTWVSIKDNEDDTYTVKAYKDGAEVPVATAVAKNALVAAMNESGVLKNVVGKNMGDPKVFPIVQPSTTIVKTYSVTADILKFKVGSSYEFFKNTEQLDVSVLLAPYGDILEARASGLSAKQKVYDEINNNLMLVAQERGDCMVILDYPESFSYQQVKHMFEANNYLHCDMANACTIYPNITYRNPYLNEVVSLPASAILSGQMVYTDSVKHCWFAPAGFGNQKGVIPDALSVAKQLTKEERDELYELHINPLMYFVGQGVVVWGNRTMKDTNKYEQDSVYVQISVRRLANYIRKIVINASMSTLFEPNDVTTWNNWKNKIRPRLREIQNNRGCEDFKIVMDRTTISDDDIANGRAPAVIYVKPTMAIEYIPINFVMTRSSVIFGEGEEAEA